MREKTNNILKILSNISLVLSIFMIIPLIVALANKEDTYKAFIISIAICLFLYILSLNSLSNDAYVFKNKDSYLVATLSWITLIILGTLPYLFSSTLPNFFDALFESASGFTTTGATVFTNLEILPKSIIMYRSCTHFIGGMGILVLLSTILSSWGINGQIVTSGEQTGPNKGKLSPRFKDTTRSLYIIYITITIVLFLLLLLGGMNVFDSINISFSVVSTGGFSGYTNSFASFNTYLRIVVIIFMIIASTNFNLLIFNGKSSLKRLFNDEEFRFYLGIIAIATMLILSVNYVYLTKQGIRKNIIDSLFQVVSIISTTGLTTTDFNIWPTFSKIILFSLFFIGGCANSTSGGIKSIRVLISMKLVRRSFSLKIHPKRITYVKINKNELPQDVISKTTTYLFTYFLILICGTLLLSIDNLNIFTALSSAASFLGNIGPTFELFDFSNLSMFSKLISSLLMLMGRLEILTIFALFSRKYWNTNK